MDSNKLGMIAFGKVKQLEKRIKVIEDWIDEQRKASAQEVRDNRGTIQ